MPESLITTNPNLIIQEMLRREGTAFFSGIFKGHCRTDFIGSKIKLLALLRLMGNSQLNMIPITFSSKEVGRIEISNSVTNIRPMVFIHPGSLSDQMSYEDIEFCTMADLYESLGHHFDSFIFASYRPVKVGADAEVNARAKGPNIILSGLIELVRYDVTGDETDKFEPLDETQASEAVEHTAENMIIQVSSDPEGDGNDVSVVIRGPIQYLMGVSELISARLLKTWFAYLSKRNP